MRKSIILNKLVTSTGMVAVLSLLLQLPLRASAAPFDREFTIDADELRIANLIGAVELRPHAGKEFLVKVHVRGDDASDKLIRFEQGRGRRAELIVIFPTDEHRKYVYPAIGSDSRMHFSPHTGDKGDSDWLDQLLDVGHGGIEVRGSPYRDALEVWADLEIEVPQDRRVAVHLGAGSMHADGVHGDVELDACAGNVDVEDSQGDVIVDTGSGAVRVNRVAGNVDLDTGSGSVQVSDIKDGRWVKLDTGSGSVNARTVEAEELRIDTGSGSVEVEGAQVQELAVDTGSGGVDATDVGADGVSIDTGSGGVWLQMVRMGRGSYLVETGSGRIQLQLPATISAAFQIDTGSGGISVDIPGVELDPKQKREARFTVGNGESRVKLSTGSGSVNIVQAGRSNRRK